MRALKIKFTKGEYAMASFNKLHVVGYLGRDPEIRYTPQGAAVCSFSIATTEKRKDRSGDLQDHTTWFRVTAWGRLAEIANQYLAKGKQVYVEGRLRKEDYTDNEGNARTSLVVTATDIQFLGQKNGAGQPHSVDADRDQFEVPEEDDEAPTRAPARSNRSSSKGRNKNAELVTIEEEDVPF
jgi:single-strand DNA-binding protein